MRLTLFWFVVLMIALLFIAPLIFMLLWNAISSGVFGAPELGYWQSWGVIILLGMIGGAFTSALSNRR